MSIGLYDADTITFQRIPFNLELMKLAAYYKKNRQIVRMVRSMDFEHYSKFIYRQDFYNDYFPTFLLTQSNVEYGGLAFNPGCYIPLDEEIEKSKPDTSIYETFNPIFDNLNAWYNVECKTMFRAQHFRISLDNYTIWDNFKQQINFNNQSPCMFVHDYNLNQIDNAAEVLQDLKNYFEHFKNNLSLSTKFPIQVDNDKDLFRWTQFSPSSYFYNLKYNGVMSDELFNDFYLIQKNTSIDRQTDYHVTYNINEEDFIKNTIHQLYYQELYAKNNRMHIKFSYDNDFFTDKRWGYLLELFNGHINSCVSMKKDKFNYLKGRDPFIRYIKHLNTMPVMKDGTKLSRDNLKDIFALVQKTNYDLFKDFYICADVKLQGGKFIDDTVRH